MLSIENSILQLIKLAKHKVLYFFKKYYLLFSFKV